MEQKRRFVSYLMQIPIIRHVCCICEQNTFLFLMNPSELLSPYLWWMREFAARSILLDYVLLFSSPRKKFLIKHALWYPAFKSKKLFWTLENASLSQILKKIQMACLAAILKFQLKEYAICQCLKFPVAVYQVHCQVFGFNKGKIICCWFCVCREYKICLWCSNEQKAAAGLIKASLKIPVSL